jgi:hypothetical protein
MPAPAYNDSKEKLIETMRATSGSGSRQFDIAKAILDVKAREELKDETKKLGIATWVLALATVGLVIATIGLLIVTIKIKY